MSTVSAFVEMFIVIIIIIASTINGLVAMEIFNIHAWPTSSYTSMQNKWTLMLHGNTINLTYLAGVGSQGLIVLLAVTTIQTVEQKPFANWFN